MRYINLVNDCKIRQVKLIFTAIVAVIYCMSAQAGVQISNAYVRGLPPGQPVTAAFMQLDNLGDKPITIVAASSDSAKRTEIHTHMHRNGMMRMEKVDRVVVPAGGKVVMKPGGYHLMLIDLHKPLREGDTVKVQLQTTTGENINVQLPVRSVLNEHKHH